MAKYIHDGLLYDTDKMKFMGEINSPYMWVDSVKLYKTPNNHFYIIGRNLMRNSATYDFVDETDLKRWLEKDNDFVMYEKAFGKLEEA